MKNVFYYITFSIIYFIGKMVIILKDKDDVKVIDLRMFPFRARLNF